MIDYKGMTGDLPYGETIDHKLVNGEDFCRLGYDGDRDDWIITRWRPNGKLYRATIHVGLFPRSAEKEARDLFAAVVRDSKEDCR